MQHIKRQELDFVKAFLPDETTMQRFNETVGGMLLECSRLNACNKNLKQTCDVLLPRLLSGKIEVENLDIRFPLSMQAAECIP